jgi:hypothetical protein
MINANDGNFIAYGKLNNIPCIMKFDNNGNLMWKRDYINLYNITESAFSRLNDGYICSIKHFNRNIAKIDENGDTMVTKNIPLLGLFSIMTSLDNKILIVGFDSSKSHVLKCDFNLNVETIIDLTPAPIEYIKQTSDSGFVSLGTSAFGYENDLFLAKFDKNGNLQKDTVYARWGIDSYPTALDFDVSGNYVINGWAPEGPIGGNDIMFFCQKQWNFSTSVDILSGETEFSVYPNPAQDFIFLQNEESANYTYRIIDIAGQVIFDGESFFETNHQINVNSLKTGIYFILIYNNTTNQISKLKFIKN